MSENMYGYSTSTCSMSQSCKLVDNLNLNLFCKYVRTSRCIKSNFYPRVNTTLFRSLFERLGDSSSKLWDAAIHHFHSLSFTTKN
jgi:hypothetical protein